MSRGGLVGVRGLSESRSVENIVRGGCDIDQRFDLQVSDKEMYKDKEDVGEKTLVGWSVNCRSVRTGLRWSSRCRRRVTCQ